MEDFKADGSESELLPGVDEGGMSVIADTHATVAFDPTDGSYDGPSEAAQMRTVRSLAESMP